MWHYTFHEGNMNRKKSIQVIQGKFTISSMGSLWAMEQRKLHIMYRDLNYVRGYGKLVPSVLLAVVNCEFYLRRTFYTGRQFQAHSTFLHLICEISYQFMGILGFMELWWISVESLFKIPHFE